MLNSQLSIPSTRCPVRDQLYQPQKVVGMTRQFIYGQAEFRHLKTKNKQDFSNRSAEPTSNRPSTSFTALMEALWQKEHSFSEIAWSLEPDKTHTVHGFSFILNSRTEQIHLAEFHLAFRFCAIPLPVSKQSSGRITNLNLNWSKYKYHLLKVYNESCRRSHVSDLCAFLHFRDPQLFHSI